jgi:hypothetical protein
LYDSNELQRKGYQAKCKPVLPGDQTANQVNALRIDFVASPGNSRDLASDIAKLLEHAELHREGLQASMLLVSDRETRLVTLLTLWQADCLQTGRERLTSWLVKLVSRFADGPPRAHTSVARFLLPSVTSKLTLSDLRPEEMAELVEIVTAG